VVGEVKTDGDEATDNKAIKADVLRELAQDGTIFSK
jgi:hypothetical protein